VNAPPREALPLDPLPYRAVEPRTTQQQLASVIARLLAIGCMLYTIRPIIGAVNVAVGQGRNYAYYQQFGRPMPILAVLARTVLPWTTGAAALLVIVSSVGLVVGKGSFRLFLVISVSRNAQRGRRIRRGTLIGK
jgi:hypothetical protein